MQSGKLFLGPAFQRGVNRLPAGLQIARDAFRIPSFRVQLDNRPSALKGIGDLRPTLESARAGRFWASGQGQLDRLRGGLTPKLHKKNGGQLVRAESRIL